MTIEELEQRMSRAELQTWIAYIDENGPLNPSLRIEAAVARAVAPFMGRGVSVRELMPWPKEPEQEASLAETFALFKGLAKQKDRKH